MRSPVRIWVAAPEKALASASAFFNKRAGVHALFTASDTEYNRYSKTMEEAAYD